MHFLFDIAHPVDVHFYRLVAEQLKQQDHEIILVSRRKDIVCDLLDGYGLDHSCIGLTPKKNKLLQGVELIDRVWRLVRIIKERRIDMVLTRNPSGAIAARMCGIPSIYDTTDGRVSKIHFVLGRLFATWLTSPESLGEAYGAKHFLYPSQLHASYLHTKRFQPDRVVCEELMRLGFKGTNHAILRFVAFSASHDHGEKGLSWAERRKIVAYFKDKGDVFIVSEDPLPADLAPYAFPLAPHRFLHALSFARCVVGDGVSACVEAAFLGVPAFLHSSYGDKLSYVQHLREEEGLIERLDPTDLIAGLERAWDAPTSPLEEKRDKYFSETIDLVDWYCELIETLKNGSETGH
ncbi:hypothetical protein [Terasakiella pusilla]|uniref:hypothetical protein n=1 Tax=Terasakiella pusilla TaxID=64973 RepID=UPI003AA88D67